MSKLRVFICIVIPIIFTVLPIAFVYNHQSNKDGKIPLVFSEISQVKRNYQAQGMETPPITVYYGVVNDLSMKVFEAYNLSFRTGGDHTSFAKELEFKIDPTFRVHHRIDEYANEFPDIQSKALSSVQPLIQISKELTPIIEALNNSWDEEYIDVTHTEIETVTVSDGNGKSHTETRLKTVYDYTRNIFTYYPSYAKTASDLLLKFKEAHPDLLIENVAPKITETGAENESAISGAIGKLIDSDRAKSIVLKNYHDSIMSKNREGIYVDHRKIVRVFCDRFTSTLKTAKSDEYRTYYTKHDGSNEYQTEEKTLCIAMNLKSSIDSITDPIIRSNGEVQSLNKNILKYIHVVLDREKGDEDDLKEAVLEGAEALYKGNFQNDIKIDRFSKGLFIVSIFLFVILGGVMFYYLNYYTKVLFKK